MSGAHGTKNAILVLNLLAEGGNIADKMIHSPGSLVSKLMFLGAAFDEIISLTGLDAKELVEEFKEMDAADMAALHEAFKAKFDLQDDKVEALVEEGIMLAKEYGDAVLKTVEWVKKLKAPAAAPVV